MQEKTVIAMNFNNLSGTLTRNADKIGAILGFVTGNPQGFAGVESIIENVISGNIHAPDLKEAFHYLATEPFVKTGIITALIGYILKESGLKGISKFGVPLQKFGVSYAMGSVTQKILWHSTHSDEGSANHLKTFGNGRSSKNSVIFY